MKQFTWFLVFACVVQLTWVAATIPTEVHPGKGFQFDVMLCKLEL